MTVVQKLTIRLSEIRSKLNELSGLETPSKEEVSQMETLGKEYQDKEIQFRSAVIVEGEKQAGKEFLDDGEGAEIRSIKNKCSIISYVNAAAKGSGLSGPEAELNDALEVRNGGGIQVPWTMLYSDKGLREEPKAMPVLFPIQERRTAARHRDRSFKGFSENPYLRPWESVLIAFQLENLNGPLLRRELLPR